MMEHTVDSMEENELLIVGSLGVNFFFLKNFEDERHKLIQITWTKFCDFCMAAKEPQLYSTTNYICIYILLKFSHTFGFSRLKSM